MLTFKLFSTSLILISLLSFKLAEATRSTQVGDVAIKFSNDKLFCDKIVCPLDSVEFCSISKEQDRDDPSILIRSNLCHMKAGRGKNIAFITRSKTNPESKVIVSIRVEANGDIRLHSSESDANFNTINENRLFQI